MPEKELLKLTKELIAMQRELSIQNSANTNIISAILNSLSERDLQFVSGLLRFQSEAGELHGVALESNALDLKIVCASIDKNLPSEVKAKLRLVKTDTNESP